MSDVLIRYAPRAAVFQHCMICYVLGEIDSQPHERVSNYLAAQALSPIWAVRLEAVIARYKSFVNNEGLFRANHRGQTKVDHDELVATMTSVMPPYERLICLLGFASVHAGPLADVFRERFSSDYTALQAKLEALVLPLFNDDDANSKAAMVKQLIQTHDYVGLSVHIAICLDGGESHPLYRALIEACCQGSIIAASNYQATRHLAVSYFLKKDFYSALEVARSLADRNPDCIDAQILVAQILSEIVGAEADARDRVSEIRGAYKLSEAQEAELAAVEAEVNSRLSNYTKST